MSNQLKKMGWILVNCCFFCKLKRSRFIIEWLAIYGIWFFFSSFKMSQVLHSRSSNQVIREDSWQGNGYIMEVGFCLLDLVFLRVWRA